MSELNHPYFRISESEEYGVELLVRESERAYAFKDFLDEDCFVFFNVQFKGEDMIFFFGQSSCIEKVRSIIARFEQKLPSS